MLALALAINLMGTKSLAMAALVGFTAELLGALAVGTWLLITERYHNLSVLFDTEGVGAGGSYFSAFVAAALIGIHQYYGFEACGDVAEEVPDPTRQIPMVMRMTIHVGGAAAIFVLGSVYSTKALTSIISFATLGIHPGFQMVVFAALRARLKGWQPNGAVRLGRWGMPVTIAALTYGVLAMVNMASPRTPEAPWCDNWLVALSAAAGAGIGAIYLAPARPHDRSDATAGDAIPDPARTAGPVSL